MVNIPEIVTEPLDRNNLASLNKKKTAPISKENVFILNARTRRVDDPVQAAPRQPTQRQSLLRNKHNAFTKDNA